MDLIRAFSEATSSLQVWLFNSSTWMVSRAWRIFQGPSTPELTEDQKALARKRQQLSRVIERLQSPPLTQGMARELRKQQAILEREIAELQGGG